MRCYSDMRSLHPLELGVCSPDSHKGHPFNGPVFESWHRVAILCFSIDLPLDFSFLLAHFHLQDIPIFYLDPTLPFDFYFSVSPQLSLPSTIENDVLLVPVGVSLAPELGVNDSQSNTSTRDIDQFETGRVPNGNGKTTQ